MELNGAIQIAAKANWNMEMEIWMLQGGYDVIATPSALSFFFIEDSFIVAKGFIHDEHLVCLIQHFLPSILRLLFPLQRYHELLL